MSITRIEEEGGSEEASSPASTATVSITYSTAEQKFSVKGPFFPAACNEEEAEHGEEKMALLVAKVDELTRQGQECRRLLLDCEKKVCASSFRIQEQEAKVRLSIDTTSPTLLTPRRDAQVLNANSLIALAALTSMMDTLDGLLAPFGATALDALNKSFWAAFGGEHCISFAPTPWRVLNDRQALYRTQVTYTRALRARARFLLAFSVLTLCTVAPLIFVYPFSFRHLVYRCVRVGGARGVDGDVRGRLHEGLRKEFGAHDRRHEQLRRCVVAVRGPSRCVPFDICARACLLAELTKATGKKFTSESLFPLTVAEGVERFKIALFIVAMVASGTRT